MNGRVAKQLRREIHGRTYSPRFRSYQLAGGQLIADVRRQAYQQLKKGYREILRRGGRYEGGYTNK